MPAEQENSPAQGAGAGQAAGSTAASSAQLARLVLSNLQANINLTQQNAVASQQGMNELSIATLGKCVNFLARVR